MEGYIQLNKQRNMKIELTNFAERHFSKKFVGTKILDISKEEFISRINTIYDNKDDILEYIFRDGYAEFCKLLFIKNTFSASRIGTMNITLENYSYLRSGYSSRNNSELPTLSRWFEIPRQFIPTTKWFNIVLYSREQLYKEWLENPESKELNVKFDLSDDCDFGIVAILGQSINVEEPMKPETMLRNYMPLEYGGSGMKYPTLKKDKEEFNKNYMECVNFWKNSATVK